MLGKTARFLYFNFFVRPIVFLYLGVNIRRRNLIPKQGPAILVANHNSHLDTMVLMIACPRSLFRHLRPVAAADYSQPTLKMPRVAQEALQPHAGRIRHLQPRSAPLVCSTAPQTSATLLL